MQLKAVVPSREVVLSGWFTMVPRSLGYGRARLFADRIVLTSLGWRGVRRRTIPLDQVREVEWARRPIAFAIVTFHLHDGEALALRMAGGGLWKHHVESLLGKRFSLKQDLPDRPAPMRVTPAA